MKTYIINGTYLIAAENEAIAKNLAEAKFGGVRSVKQLGQ